MRTGFSYSEIETALSDDNITIFNYADSDFRKFWSRKVNKVLHEVEVNIVRRNMPRTNSWFLDLGAGFGRLTPNYAGLNPRVVLVDYSLKNLTIASGIHRQSGIHFVAADAYRMPFKDGIFGGGLCVRTFHHMQQPDRFLCELRRVVCTEAEVLFTYTNKHSLLRILRYGLKHVFREGHTLLSKAVYGTGAAYFRRVARSEGFASRHIAGEGFLHQLDNSTNLIEKLGARSSLMYRFLKMAELAADAILGPLRLSFLQFVVLKALRQTAARESECGNGNLMDVLKCPCCGNERLEVSENHVICSACGRCYPMVGCILDFRV